MTKEQAAKVDEVIETFETLLADNPGHRVADKMKKSLLELATCLHNNHRGESDERIDRIMALVLS